MNFLNSVFCACLFSFSVVSYAQKPVSWQEKAKQMVEDQLVSRSIKDERVIESMLNTPRHLFVPENLSEKAYRDGPLPIGNGQTISQPYIVALMTSLLELKGNEKVLEIGTGSGYQAAILSQLCDSVFSIEIVESLAKSAKIKLDTMGYKNVVVKLGDGYQGWAEKAPFDGIIVTASPPEIPKNLVEQLKIGGRMVLPVGKTSQELKLIIKEESEVKIETITGVRFVPMVHPKD
ncbi:MAG: protein-L-isoaspartate O-methyltransferase [Flavobacteriales bacterium]|nr:MAG: protein-L-isoaspartate O-methyltransferase [Flavobacteriales bacterium]